MVEIIPAVMPDDFEELQSSVGRVHSAVEWVQVDVMDGRFTNSVSWPYAPGSTHFDAMVQDEEGLPFWETVNYELDLMVADPEVEAERWIETGVARMVLHETSFKNTEQAVALMQMLRSRGVEVVLALLPTASVDAILPYVEHVDGIQCMGILEVGFQGEPFDERVYDLVRGVRETYPDVSISVDGGVNTDTAPLLVEAGATRLISGSFIFTSEDAKASIAELKKISNV